MYPEEIASSTLSVPGHPPGPLLIADGEVLIKRCTVGDSNFELQSSISAEAALKFMSLGLIAGARNHNFASRGSCARADKGAYPLPLLLSRNCL